MPQRVLGGQGRWGSRIPPPARGPCVSKWTRATREGGRRRTRGFIGGNDWGGRGRRLWRSVVGGWRNEGSGNTQAIVPCSSIYGSLKVASVSILERSALTNLYCYRAQIRRDAVQSWVWGREWVEAADDTSEIVLVLGYEALNSRNGFRPDPEEGDEGDRAIVFR